MTGSIIIAVCACAVVLAAVLKHRTATGSRQLIAVRDLSGYALRLREAADKTGQPYANTFWDMAEYLERISAEVALDERDLNAARPFIFHHVGVIVGIAEKFVVLHDKARPEHMGRIDAMAQQLDGYRDVFAKVLRACIDHDFEDLETTMAALDVQLKRLPS
ncbi:MAG: hypothetical protein ACPG5U_08320 [Planktomarina sp.]